MNMDMYISRNYVEKKELMYIYITEIEIKIPIYSDQKDCRHIKKGDHMIK